MVLFHPKNQRKLLTIGIAAAASGLGATHLCIALANYLASKKGAKTACLELSSASSFEEIRNNCVPAFLPAKTSAHRSFRIYDVDYYPNVKKEEIPALTNAGYEILIFDFGFPVSDCLDEFYRCDKKLLLGSAACWRRQELASFLSAYPQIRNLESLFFMILYGTKSDVQKISKLGSIPRQQMRAVPFLLNPFHIGKEQFSFFEELL